MPTSDSTLFNSSLSFHEIIPNYNKWINKADYMAFTGLHGVFGHQSLILRVSSLLFFSPTVNIFWLCVLLVLTDAGLCGGRLFRLNVGLFSCLSCLGKSLQDVLTIDTQVCCDNSVRRRGGEALQRIRQVSPDTARSSDLNTEMLHKHNKESRQASKRQTNPPPTLSGDFECLLKKQFTFKKIYFFTEFWRYQP